MTTSVNLTMIYGAPVESSSSPMIRKFEEYIRTWSAYLHPSSVRPLDIFPSLRSWPSWMPWNRTFDRVNTLKWSWSGDMFDQLERSVDQGDADELQTGSFVNTVRTRNKEFGFDKKEDLV
jgi:hypothetical protein